MIDFPKIKMYNISKLCHIIRQSAKKDFWHKSTAFYDIAYFKKTK
jgi:hypothetical protein